MGTTQTTDMSGVPGHVPKDLVRKIGLTMGPEFLASPHAFMTSLHETQPPIFFNPAEMEQAKAAWMLTKFEDCYHVLRHPEIFSTRGATPFPRDPQNPFKFIPLEIDPPHHRRYRNILAPIFSPQGVGALETYITDLANSLIDDFIDKGECEFTTDFGRPLPVCVFLDLMGLPQNMRDEFVSWAVGLLHSQDPRDAEAAMINIVGYLQKVIQKKTAAPDGKVISTIIQSRPDGKPMTDMEIFGFVLFLFIGGLDTVFATLNNIFLWLANNPERRKEIIDNPDNLSNVVEELLRINAVTFSGRTVEQDCELRGVKMKKNDKVTCILPAANMDADIFENPGEVNFHRPRKPILSFAGGAHSCMGAHLARLEIKVCITEFLRRIPNFQVKEGAEIEYWPGGVIGPRSLPLTW
jgi:cytochrome P450